MLPPKDANRGGGFQETMKLRTYYTTIEHQTEWNQSKEEIEEKNPYKISQTLDAISHGKSMSHQQDIARRDVQHVRKDIVNTEGGLTLSYWSFLLYVWLAHSREIDLDI